MLFQSGEMSKPERIQSAYISENEVKKVVKYLTDEYQDELNTGIDFSNPQMTSGLYLLLLSVATMEMWEMMTNYMKKQKRLLL